MNPTSDFDAPRHDLEGEPTPRDGSPSDTSDLVQRVARGAHATIDQLERGLQSSVEQARVTTDEWTTSSRSLVREHPLASIGGAFLVGLICGRLLR